MSSASIPGNLCFQMICRCSQCSVFPLGLLWESKRLALSWVAQGLINRTEWDLSSEGEGIASGDALSTRGNLQAARWDD